MHIILDFQKDQNHNLNYFALDILNQNNLQPSDLKTMANGGNVTDDFRNVIREYCNIAENYRTQTKEVLEKLDSRIDPQYLLSLHIIYNLYAQIFERIDISNGMFTTEELNPAPYEVKEKVIEVITQNYSFIEHIK